MVALEGKRNSKPRLAEWQALTDELANLRRHYYLECPHHFQRLLPELLFEVFQWCIFDDWAHSTPMILSAPVNVSRVCRTWRQVALARPQLWSHMRFKLNCFNQQNIRRSVSSAKTWVSRSGCVPLVGDVAICLHPWWCGFRVENAFAGALEKFLATCVRWRRMQLLLWTQTYSDLSPVLEVNLGEMPHLEELALSFVCDRTGDDRCPFPLKGQVNLSRCSRLKTLQIKHCDFKLTSDGSMMPNLDRVTLFNMYPNVTSPSVEECLMILRLAPSLDACHFAFASNVIPDSPQEVLSMQRLKRLEVQTWQKVNSRVFEYFLEHLLLPSLRVLSIRWTGADGVGQTGRCLVSLIQRSQSPLYHLSVHVHGMTEDEIVACLNSTPNLRHLNVRCSTSTDRLLEALAVTGASRKAVLCPKLRHIILNCTGRPPGRESVKRVLQSRWRAQVEKRRLQKVEIVSSNGIPNSYYNSKLIEKFIGEGLVFKAG